MDMQNYSETSIFIEFPVTLLLIFFSPHSFADKNYRIVAFLIYFA